MGSGMRAHLECQAEPEMRDNLRSGAPSAGLPLTPQVVPVPGSVSEAPSAAEGSTLVQAQAGRAPWGGLCPSLEEAFRERTWLPASVAFSFSLPQAPGRPDLRPMVGVNK